MANKDVKIQIKAVNKTKKAFMAVTAGLKSISRAAFSMKSAIGLAAGAVGLGYLVKKSMDATDSMAKVSRSIGISVTELQRLRHAASIGGLEAKSLDKAMQKLAINISDVASGTGIAKEAFDRYGISSTNIDGSTRSVTDVLGQAATALETMTNETDRASFVYDLFGARGAKVINMLKDGKDAMEAMKKEADELGLVMSLELIEGVENANDSIARLSDYLGNVFHRVVASIAPIIESASEAVRSFVEMKINKQGGITQFSKNIAIAILEAARSIVEASTSMLNSLGRIATGAARAIQKVLLFLPTNMGGLRTLKAIKLELLDISMQRDKASQFEDANWFGEIDKLNKKEKALQKLITAGQYIQEIEPFENFRTSGAILELNQLLAKMKGFPDDISLPPIVPASGSLIEITPIEPTVKSASDNLGLPKFNPEAYETETEAILRAQRERNLEVLLMIDQGDIGIVRAAELRANAEVTAQESLTEIVKKGEQDRLTIENLSAASRNKLAISAGRETLGVLAQHNKKAFQINKAAAISEALVNTYKGVSQALTLPFPLNLMMSALALANGMSQVQSIRATQYRANGGPMSAGSPYIVGERGPELIVPNQASNVVPNDQLGGGNFTINISANDTAGFDELLTKRRGTLMNLINQSLNERGRPALA